MANENTSVEFCNGQDTGLLSTDRLRMGATRLRLYAVVLLHNHEIQGWFASMVGEFPNQDTSTSSVGSAGWLETL